MAPSGSNSKPKGVLMSAMYEFLFPPHLEHPESTGRLDVFAHYGPCDDAGNLRAGPLGKHVQTDGEIRHMIWRLNRQTFELLFFPLDKNVSMAEINELVPKANRHAYTKKEITRLFNTVCPDKNGRCDFNELQKIILADQHRRFRTLMKGGEICQATREPLPYITRPQEILTYVTRQKRVKKCEEYLVVAKHLNGMGCQIAPMELQNASAQLAANVRLMRSVGSTKDRWDRYCAIRQTGKNSYVKARSHPRQRISGIDDLSSKCPGVSTLWETMSLNGPRTAKKVYDGHQK